MWCDVRVHGSTWAAILVLVTSGLVVSGPAVADHGPFPTGGPTTQAAQAFQEDTQASLGTAQGTVGHSHEQSMQAVQAVIDGLGQGHVQIPLAHVDSVLEGSFQDTEEIWLRTIGSASDVHAATGIQLDEAEAFQELLVTAAMNRAGIDTQDPIGSVTGPPRPCVDDLKQAVDDAGPGEEILVCAGTYQGPIHVRQHFLSIIAEQGPAATVIEGAGQDGLVINATGVTVSGFRVQGANGNGTAGIRIGGDTTHPGVQGPVGTVLTDNEFRRNTHGVIVQRAPGTVLAGNTFWASMPGPDGQGGIGVLVAADLTEPGVLEESQGVWVAANNFQNNAHHAIKSLPGSSMVPTLWAFALFNHYNSPLGPNLQIGDACHGPAAPDGDPQCRDGVGHGVVPIGHHVQPW